MRHEIAECAAVVAVAFIMIIAVAVIIIVIVNSSSNSAGEHDKSAAVLLIDFAGEGGCSIGQVVIGFKQDDARWCRMRCRCWLRWSCVTAQRL